ncbi:Zinc finger CCHC domain-containing protein 2 [Gryllus bimaculatus]|nr:Zinc finger CCHC domain-containing protein 2 [Gryllus bimaculatus]
MVCKEDVVTWFKELTSHKRIDVMCTLLNMCLPFELRFLGTCLEDLGKRDFHDLRDVENRANNVSELSDLQCFSDKRTQRKLALYLALLHSCNHACSNGLYKILANFDFGEINNLTNNSSEENPLDELLLLYTLALNHPAFTYEQRAMFGNILVKLQDEENKLYAARHSVGIGLVYVKNPMQACVPCPASDEQGQLGPCTGLTMPPTHPAGHQQLPAVQWHGAPLMMTSLCSTLPSELRRMSDDELKDLGLPAGAIHQLRAIVTKLNNTNGISTLDKREPGPVVNRRKQENNADEVAERKNQHAAPVLQRINRFPLEGAPMVYPPPSLLSAPAAPCFTCFVPVTSAPGRYPPQPQPYCCVGHGMRGLRIDDSARHCSNSSSAASDSSSASHSPPDTPSMPTTPQWERVYPGKEINLGERWSPGCEDHTEKDRRLTEPTEKPGGEETNSGAPPSQPPGVHATNISVTSSTTANNNNTTTSSNNNSSSSSSSTNSNSNNRPRVPGLGRGKPTPPGLQLPRGRGPNPTTVILEGNHKTLPSCRREGPTMNGAQPPPRTSHPPPTPPHDDRKMYFVPSDMAHTYSTVNSTSQPPPPQYSGGTCGNNPQHRPADMSGGSSNVPYSPATAAAFLPHTHFNALRSTGSLFPSFAHSSYMRPFPFSPNGELVYQYHGPQTPPPPPPTAFIPTPMVAAFSPVVPPPKVSCYNCGSQSHHASDCKDPTMEEMTKPGQYRIDYVPYQKPGECSSEK